MQHTAAQHKSAVVTTPMLLLLATIGSLQQKDCSAYSSQRDTLAQMNKVSMLYG